MRKLISISLGLLLAVYLMVVLGFVRDAYDGIRCKGVEVIVRDSLEYRFIKAADIRNLIRLEHPEIAGVQLSELDAAGMEEELLGLPAIQNVQVNKTVDGTLMIELFQRVPIVRVEDRDHRQYYLDEDGNVIPAVSGYTPHLLLVNGHIDGAFRQQKNVMEGMKDIMNMARYISGDPFWNAQIVQVYVNRKGEFELVPRVGAHIILFGDGRQLEQKFFKLETLYREGFRQKGWNQYEFINLKYNNQVICTKR